MTDHVAERISPLIEQVLAVQDAARSGNHLTIESVRRSLEKILDKLKKDFESSPDLTSGFYALVYWTDEILIKSEAKWQYAESWKAKTMELRYFGTRQAFQHFWIQADQSKDRVAKIAKNRGVNSEALDALEIFFLCAALGFRGLRGGQDAEFVKWFEDVHPYLDLEPPPSKETSAVEGYWGLPPRIGDRFLIVAGAVVSVTAVLTLLAFIAAVHSMGY